MTDTSETGVALTPKERTTASLALLLLGAIAWVALWYGAAWVAAKIAGAPFGWRFTSAVAFLILIDPVVTAISRAFIKAARTV